MLPDLRHGTGNGCKLGKRLTLGKRVPVPVRQVSHARHSARANFPSRQSDFLSTSDQGTVGMIVPKPEINDIYPCFSFQLVWWFGA